MPCSGESHGGETSPALQTLFASPTLGPSLRFCSVIDAGTPLSPTVTTVGKVMARPTSARPVRPPVRARAARAASARPPSHAGRNCQSRWTSVSLPGLSFVHPCTATARLQRQTARTRAGRACGARSGYGWRCRSDHGDAASRRRSRLARAAARASDESMGHMQRRRQPVKAGETALRAHLLNVTRSVRDLVPLCFLKIVLATTRWTPVGRRRGLTLSL